MKRTMLLSALLAVAVAGGWYTAQAGPGDTGYREPQAPGNEFGCRGPMGWQGEDGRLGHFARMAEELDLSEGQRQEIEAIIKASHEKNRLLRERIFAGKQQLWEAYRNDDTNDGALDGLAAEQAKLMSEMLVSRLQTKKQIFAVLTPQQQEQAEKIQASRVVGYGCGGPGNGPGCGGPGSNRGRGPCGNSPF